MDAMRPASAGTYLYCLTFAGACADGAPPLERAGIGGDTARPRAIQFADLAAIVCDAPYARYDITRANLLAHEEVIEEVMARADVLPVRFGTVAESDQVIQEQLLRRGAGALRQQLARIHGCVELGLKVFWQSERIFAEIAGADATIRVLRDDIAGQEPAAAYALRIELGELVAGAIERMRDREAEWLLAALRPLARELQINPPQMDLMALNASFLVTREAVAGFEGHVAALRQEQRHRLIVKLVGPLPTYSFVDLALSGEDSVHGIIH